MWLDMTKRGEVMWLLKAIEQNKIYLEHSLNFVLKIARYCNNQSDLGQGSLIIFRPTTSRGASKKAVPFSLDPLHK
jgi:hypothetical protein